MQDMSDARIGSQSGVDNDSIFSELLSQQRGSGRQTAHQLVRDVLRRAILNGRLPPGTRLVQSELAESLSVSTTPVREAMFDLASEGLIRLDRHRGGAVRELNQEELLEIHGIRRVLEPYALQMAMSRLTDDIVDHMRTLHWRMMEEPDSADWVDLNREFHSAIYDATGAPRLADILKGLLDAGTMYVGSSQRRSPTNQAEANQKHSEILEALAARDVDRVVAATLEHMKLTLSNANAQT